MCPQGQPERAGFCVPWDLADDAAAEADGHGMGARARLELREEMPDVRFNGLFGKEEPLADLPIDETIRDQLKDLDLPHRRLLLELPERALERNHLAARARPAAGGDLLEPPRMIGVAVQDLLALSSVHARGIGLPQGAL